MGDSRQLQSLHPDFHLQLENTAKEKSHHSISITV